MNRSPQSPGHALVVGAGIIGLTTAWRLQRDGWRVTVVDRQHPGAGASGGNGAQLSYSYVQPLADPSIWRQLPKLLLAADSPLKFRLQADPHQWAWGLRFLAACRGSVSRDTTARLLALAAASRLAFDDLREAEQLDCDFSSTGKLVLYPDAASFDAARRQLDLQRALGGQPQTALTPAQCQDVEPALAHYAPRIAGGIHTPSECAADCLKVCLALHQRLADRGVRFELDRTVKGWVREADRIIAVRTDAGDLQADQFVLAAGTASAGLGRALGLDVPVYPLKGYSITLPVPEAPGQAPQVSVTDIARKVVFARLGARLRVAGIAELVGDDMRVLPERIASLAATTGDVFPQLAQASDLGAWSGLRPATPTGWPLIGRAAGAPANLLLNTGHGALGFTLAMGSAERVAQALNSPD
ncbi:D-amino acid dehydrogenase [Hydrogenophaga sp. NFH-34]|uniref:D-amino acid dehydrogenase n=1 Tax=Hydrogenophaga sp. NFH-34 TaxID=2744446 RepID=UPI001F2EACFE|nr:D-amino acid dehydrogenase [Hydrogenophaga sp. NFH-34]